MKVGSALVVERDAVADNDVSPISHGCCQHSGFIESVERGVHIELKSTAKESHPNIGLRVIDKPMLPGELILHQLMHGLLDKGFIFGILIGIPCTMTPN